MQAGTLPRREFIFNGVFDDELFAEIREKKLATLLAREMIETEPKWLNYEFKYANLESLRYFLLLNDSKKIKVIQIRIISEKTMIF